MRKHRFHRWFAALGMIAMLGALAVAPMTTPMALAMAAPMPSASQPASASAAAEQMPCHKAPKSCPDCPQMACPDMSMCQVNCFQSLASPLAEATVYGAAATSRVPPALSQLATETLIPPLLRPPSA